jgi:hypothetical protein
MKPRFKVGDKVIYPDFLGMDVLTISAIEDRTYTTQGNLSSNRVKACPYVYNFENESVRAWDFQLVLAEVYDSPLLKALREENPNKDNENN